MSTELVFFLHRLGIKVYQVKSDSTVAELADIPNLDGDEIVKKLAAFSGSTVRLLTADTISYLFQCQIDVTRTPLSRDVVSQNIKSEIPEDINSILWDYKVITQNKDIANVVVFAPVADFQKLIRHISAQLHLVVEAVEPESVSITRHPNPIVGITLKNDIGETDEASLNLPFSSPDHVKQSPRLARTFILIISVVLFVLFNLFLYRKYQTGQSKPSVSPTPSIVPTSAPSPTPTLPSVKKFSDLSLLVENGTSRSGYAGSIASKFKDNGVINVTSRNADRDDYSSSQLIFISDDLKSLHLSKFLDIFPVKLSSVKVDKTQSVDAILILGIN